MKDSQPEQAAKLRQRANTTLRGNVSRSPESESATFGETQRMLHELRVYQVELEVQNEELRRAQEELAASRARYFDLYDLAPVGYVTVNDQGLILESNLAATSMLGVARGALAGQPLSRFVFPKDRDAFGLFRKRLVETSATGFGQPVVPHVCELRLLTQDGEERWAHLAATKTPSASPGPLPADAGGAVAIEYRIILSDITERKRMEIALGESERKLNQAQKFSHIGSWTWEVKTNKLVWSDEMFRIFGLEKATFAGSLEAVIAQAIHPDDRARVEQSNLSVIRHATPIPVEYRVIWPDQSVRVVRGEAGELLLDQTGQPALLSGTVQDITERIKAEAELSRAKNLAALGVLAGGIAHDFNNLLQALLGGIDMATRLTAKTSKAYPFLDLAQKTGAEATALAKKLVAFAPGEIRSRVTIQSADLVREAVAAALSGSDLQVVFDIAADLPTVHADSDQLRCVVENIARNAREALPRGGSLRVAAWQVALGSGEIARLAPGSYVRITLRDQGPGIAPEILPKIFDPYFSTKQRGSAKGMGLGLTISAAIVNKHGGAITVESEPGSGAAFHIHLPVAKRAIS